MRSYLPPTLITLALILPFTWAGYGSNGGGSGSGSLSPSVQAMAIERPSNPNDGADSSSPRRSNVAQFGPLLRELAGRESVCRVCRVGIACGDACIAPDADCPAAKLAETDANCAVEFLPLLEDVDDELMLGGRVVSHDELEQDRDLSHLPVSENEQRGNSEQQDPILGDEGRSVAGFVETEARTKATLGAKWDLYLSGAATLATGKSQVHEGITLAAGGKGSAYVSGVRWNDMPAPDGKATHLGGVPFLRDFEYGQAGRLVWESHYGSLGYIHSMAPELVVERGGQHKLVIFKQENVLFFILKHSAFWWKQAIEVLNWEVPSASPLRDSDVLERPDEKLAKTSGHGSFYIAHILHMIQDSFAPGHALRDYTHRRVPVSDELNPKKHKLPEKCGRVYLFQAYGAQMGNDGHANADHEPTSPERKRLKYCATFYSKLIIDHWEACKASKVSNTPVLCESTWQKIRRILFLIYRVPNPSAIAGGSVATMAAPPNKMPTVYAKQNLFLPRAGKTSVYLPDPSNEHTAIWDDMTDPLPLLGRALINPSDDTLAISYGPIFTPLTVSMSTGMKEYSTPENVRRMTELWGSMKENWVRSKVKNRKLRIQLAVVKAVMEAKKLPVIPKDRSDTQPGDSHRDQNQDALGGPDKDTPCFIVAGQEYRWAYVEGGNCWSVNTNPLAPTCTHGHHCAPNAGCKAKGGRCACQTGTANICKCVRQIKRACKLESTTTGKDMSFGSGGHYDDHKPASTSEGKQCFRIKGQEGFWSYSTSGDCKKNTFLTCDDAGECDPDDACRSDGGRCFCDIGYTYNDCRCVRPETSCGNVESKDRDME